MKDSQLNSGTSTPTVVLSSFGLILLCQLMGEVTVRGIGLPIPGPVLGLLLLFLTLLVRDRLALIARGPLRHGGVESTGKGLLAHLSLLFVPAGIGIVQKTHLLATHGVIIILILALSVTMTLLASAFAFTLVSRHLR
jgi:holin-like protein